MTFQELQAKYDEALSRIRELEGENARMKKVLREHGITVDEEEEVSSSISKRVLSVEERVELFRSLFKGREDVFARRWQGKEKAGYQPACANEWNRPLCDKGGNQKYKCTECPNRHFLPLTYDDVYKHLEGKVCSPQQT